MPQAPDTIRQLIGASEWGEVSFATFLTELAALMTQELHCRRAGVRMLIDTAAGRVLRTMAMHDAAHGAPVQVPDLLDPGLDDYLTDVGRSGGFVASRAEDPRIPAPMKQLLVDAGSQAVMEVAISINALIYGTLVCERAETRPWTPRELDVLRRLSIRAGSLIVRGVHDEITSPGALWEPPPTERLAPLNTHFGDLA